MLCRWRHGRLLNRRPGWHWSLPALLPRLVPLRVVLLTGQLKALLVNERLRKACGWRQSDNPAFQKDLELLYTLSDYSLSFRYTVYLIWFFKAPRDQGKKHLGSLENSSQDIAWSQTPFIALSLTLQKAADIMALWPARATGPCGCCRDGEATCVEGQHRDPSDIKKWLWSHGQNLNVYTIHTMYIWWISCVKYRVFAWHSKTDIDVCNIQII